MNRKRKILKLSDKEILQRHKISGETEYLGELYNRYIPILYGVALKYLRNTDKAQDAVMHLFTEIVPKICQLEINEFRTWIYAAMQNYCLQLSKEKSTEVEKNQDVEENESNKIFRLFDENEPETEQKKALKQCLKKLPVEQRIAIIRFYTEEMSFQDIADCTGYNLKQVKNYIRNGKHNLKICMAKNY
ncbi:MAG: sigma-70 family RNA polymerase sigma factor [Dysgonamonadaceae bacterium]|nr:sigma-70 family RNA polymerase sigma factor [Dysgonamonadaceae bacterium]